MIVGTTISCLDGGALYSPEFPRGGLAATFVVDVQQLVLGGATQFDVEIEHRNSDETTFASVGPFSAITAAGVSDVDYTGIKEIIRFKYGFSGGTPAADDAANFLMMAPSWRPY